MPRGVLELMFSATKIKDWQMPMDVIEHAFSVTKFGLANALELH